MASLVQLVPNQYPAVVAACKDKRLSMSSVQRPNSDEVEHLLRNAQLRDELEPYLDEAIMHLNQEEVPTPVENEFLASMLAWERAPILPIYQWFVARAAAAAARPA